MYRNQFESLFTAEEKRKLPFSLHGQPKLAIFVRALSTLFPLVNFCFFALSGYWFFVLDWWNVPVGLRIPVEWLNGEQSS